MRGKNAAHSFLTLTGDSKNRLYIFLIVQGQHIPPLAYNLQFSFLKNYATGPHYLGAPLYYALIDFITEDSMYRFKTSVIV